eukprot:TRINITY_DN7206_c1_g1_i1.p1 TRINITY_DN7206_c1_g1~~TRINITY_DN7206_c1_g1_i1.p1  ORF type:complete len:392 (+),score=143.97 TRINITY_DN7206_c1_g1_i1:47-1177(+)
MADDGGEEDQLPCFGQIVVGPPGSGKTTFCHGMSQYLTALGREVAIINLDPANHGERLPYKPAVDIEDLVSLEGVMSTLGLGPNGAIIYSIEFLEKNLDWLLDKLRVHRAKYLLFDFPGQVELFTHYTCIQNIVQTLQKHDYRLTAVHLVDAYHCSDASRFISVVLVSLMSMMRLELPHVNVLSKVDLIEQYGPLAFNLDFFTECTDMTRILDYIDAPARGADELDHDFKGAHERPQEESHPRSLDEDSDLDVEEEEGEPPDQPVAPPPPSAASKKLSRLTREICDVVESFGLVSFTTLDIQDGESVGRVLSKIDKANGYVVQSAAAAAAAAQQGRDPRAAANALFQSAFSGNEADYEHLASVRERYMGRTTGDDT